jgi:hypothetical protein
MTEALLSYLLQHKSLSIPGLGSMYIERIPAQADFVNKRILPPDYHFRFDKYFDAPDKDFFTYLAQQNDIADYEAIKWYNEWAYDLRNKIREGFTIEWAGIGKLKKDVSGEIHFESAGAIATLLEPVPANRVVHKNTEHTMLVGDQEIVQEIPSPEYEPYPEPDSYSKKETWWIYALIIAAVALSIIIFRFYNNGVTPSATGNQQTVQPAN